MRRFLFLPAFAFLLVPLSSAAAAYFDRDQPVRRYGPAANDPVFAGWIAEHSL